MKTTVLSCIFFLLLISCKQGLVLKAQLHHSHCGGAPPTEETKNGYDTPHDMNVIIVGAQDSIKVSIPQTSKVSLKPGNYHWYQENKLKASKDLFDGFQMTLDTSFVMEGGLACIDAWKQKSDGAFRVSRKTDTIALTLKYRCYTGILPFPCVKYIGPIYQ